MRVNRVWFLYLALVVLGAYAWRTNVRDLKVRYAWQGFSPMGYTHGVVRPENFVRDFPSGTGNLGMSAALRIYPLAHAVLGVEPHKVLPVVVAMEYVLMALAVMALVRALRPQAPPIVAVLVAVYVIASRARDPNIGGWGQPLFWGLSYNVADALRLFALATVLRGRHFAGFVLLACTYTVHPLMALMGGAFVFAALCATPRTLLRRPVLAGAGLFVVVAGLWTVCVLRMGGTTGEAFPPALWHDLARLCSTHWFPVQKGLFGVGHEKTFLPFLSFLILFGYTLSRLAPLATTERQVVAGTAAMLVLVAAGVLFSVMQASPALVRMALHRANDMILTVGLVYVVDGLWRELDGWRSWRLGPVVAALLAPFALRHGHALLFPLLVAAPAWAGLLRGERGRRVGSAIVVGLSVVAVALVALYAALGMAGPWDSQAYVGGRRLPLVCAALVVVGVVASLLKRREWLNARLVRGGVAVGLACAAAFWVNHARLPKSKVRKYKAYRSAQYWARDHTPRDALFMVDPTLYYGWRDYSQRSSFGNVREWLHTSAGYTMDLAPCREGMKRVAELGVDWRDFLDPGPDLAGFRALDEVVRRRYYAASDEWRLALARRYGIGYFVFLRSEMGAPSRLPVVFKNKYFVIVGANAGATDQALGEGHR